MLRGRGRGGRGSARGGGFTRAAVPLTPIDTYTYNPRCENRPNLTPEETQQVVVQRLLRRFQEETENFIPSSTTTKWVPSYDDQIDCDTKNPSVQLNLLVESIGPEYFPAELLRNQFVRTRQTLGASKRSVSWKELEQKEKKTGGLTTTEGDGALEDAEGAEEDEEFGGEDYAVDFAAEEDRDDEFIDDGGGGGDEW